MLFIDKNVIMTTRTEQSIQLKLCQGTAYLTVCNLHCGGLWTLDYTLLCI